MSTIQPAGGANGQNHSPAQNSPLASPPATFASEAAPAITAEVEQTAKVE